VRDEWDEWGEWGEWGGTEIFDFPVTFSFVATGAKKFVNALTISAFRVPMATSLDLAKDFNFTTVIASKSARVYDFSVIFIFFGFTKII
jgi:hypothetical protein